MKKRGQIGGEAIKYILIALVIILIQFMGYKLFTTLREKQCQTELAKFEIDLKDLYKGIEFGSVNERKYDAPCNVDKIYFIELDKDVPLSIFNKLPIIKDSLKSKVKKNVFLVKNNKLVRSFYAGNLDFEYPYYTCLIPRSNEINFFLEGRGLKVKIIPGCAQPECTEIPLDITDDEARLIIEKISNLANCEYCPTNLGKEITDFRKALNNVNIFRKFKYCSETGITEVEIIIKPKDDTKLKNFRFYEYIPKECIEDLNQYLAENVEGEVHIEGDPLIVWQFNEISEETTLNYKLNTKLAENCKKIIEGLGVTEAVEGRAVRSQETISIGYEEETLAQEGSKIQPETGPGETQQPSEGPETQPEETGTPAGEETIDLLKIEGIPDKTLDGNIKIHKNVMNLLPYTYPESRRSEFTFNIKSQTDIGLVSCSINQEKKVDCNIRKNEDGYSDITVVVSDDFLTDTDTFRLFVKHIEEEVVNEITYSSYCGDDVCNDEENCATCYKDCGNCTKKLLCGIKAEQKCVSNCYDYCREKGYPGEATGSCCESSWWMFGGCGKYSCICYDYYETECSDNPTCGSSYQVRSEWCIQ